MNCSNCSTAAKHKNDVLRTPQKHTEEQKKLPQNSQAIVTLVNRKHHTSKLQSSHYTFAIYTCEVRDFNCECGSSPLFLYFQHRSNLVTRLGKLYLQPFFCLTRFEFPMT